MEGKLGHTGAGGLASKDETDYLRKQRLKQLLNDTTELSNDPYLVKNHLGSYECKLCLTLHLSEGNYLAHTQGRRHQTNLARRNAKLNKNINNKQQNDTQQQRQQRQHASTIQRIGRPGYKLIKQYDRLTQQRSLVWQIDYTHIIDNIQPRNRFMSAVEHNTYVQQQHNNNKIYNTQQQLLDNNYQYIIFAADPYDNISFAIPNDAIDRASNKLFTHWNNDTKIFTLQLYFKNNQDKDKGK